MVLLTLDRLSCIWDCCFSDDCFLDDCFLYDCFLNGCLLLWTSQKLNSYFVEFEPIKNKYFSLICTRCSWQTGRFFYIIICQNLFLPVRTRVSYLYAFAWMLKHQNYRYFFSLKTLWHWLNHKYLSPYNKIVSASQYFS